MRRKNEARIGNGEKTNLCQPIPRYRLHEK